jgi:hypothetical protein
LLLDQHVLKIVIVELYMNNPVIGMTMHLEVICELYGLNVT